MVTTRSVRTISREDSRSAGEPSETTRQAETILKCGHSAKHWYQHPTKTYGYCRKCKNARSRKAYEEWAATATLEDWDARRAKIAAVARERRRDPKHRAKVLAYDRQRHLDNREKRLAHYREYDRERTADGRRYVSMYGVTLEDAQRAIATKPNGCEICGQSPVVFDHDPETRQFRGWLCRGHNSALGHFRHSPSELEAAIQYLQRFGQKI